MARSAVDVLRTQGRGITGALLVVGVATLYTMETWWIAWRLPTIHLLLYALGGLLCVFLVMRSVGFREGGERESLVRTAVDFSELVVQSVAAATLALLLFGVADGDSTVLSVVRLALVQAVPLGFGASLANVLLSEREDGTEEADFPRNVPIFALGAAFVVFPVAPTEEMRVIAVEAGTLRLSLLVVLSVVVVHLILHELEYQDQQYRVADRSAVYQFGLAFLVYAVGLVVSSAFLLGFGQFDGATTFEAAQLVVVLTFPASVGASGAEVVL